MIIYDDIDILSKSHISVKHSAISISANNCIVSSYLNCDQNSYFQLASLSKIIGAIFSIEYFRFHNVHLNTNINNILQQFDDKLYIKVADGLPQEWENLLTIEHLINHSGLGIHYTEGIPVNQQLNLLDYFNKIQIINKPGIAFKYSGAGYIILQYIIEKHSGQSIVMLIKPFLDALDAQNISFESSLLPYHQYIFGHKDDGSDIEGQYKFFPAFAAGGIGSTSSMLNVLKYLANAYHNQNGSSVISHQTAKFILDGKERDNEFMGCKIGNGVFILESKFNKYMIHQGANDGFRSLCMYCFNGIDFGKGFVIASTGENNSVIYNSEVSQHIIKSLKFNDVNYSLFTDSIDTTNIKQDEIVNKGYKKMIFSAFFK
jgi:Beta-lactamase